MSEESENSNNTENASSNYRRFEFLTEKEIDTSFLITSLQNILKNSDNSDDKKLLEKILQDFQKENFSILNPQIINFLNNNPIEKWSEYLIFRYKFLNFPKQKIVSNFPNYLLIEPTSACNLRCVMCFQIDKSFSSDKNFMGLMSLDLFKKIIDDAHSNGTKAITFASRGEPTMHPEFSLMLDYCKNKFLELKINTNATLLNEKLIHKILQCNVTDMVFSVDSYEKEEYEKIRVNGKFETILTNIKKFKEIRDQEYPNSTCATRISGVKFTKEQNTKKFTNFWKNYVDHVVMVEIENRWDTYHNSKDIAGASPCSYLWERMYIWYDGLCNPCDIDYKSELALGSIENNSIGEIWNNEKFMEFRELHSTNRRNLLFPCDRCPVGT